MLLEFEKTLDNANLYAYQNWMNGELVEGPDISRYWFTTTWMYPMKMMPDPAGGLRLLKYGCKVSYQKETFVEPKNLKGPEDAIDTDSQPKKAKMLEHPVWLVTIDMPRRFVDDTYDGIIEVGDEEVDVEDINAAWDENLDQEFIDGDEDVDASEEARDTGEEDIF